MDVKVFMEALEGLEEKGITKEVVFDALEEALFTACKQHYGTKDNFTVLREQSVFLNGYMHGYNSAISGIASYFSSNIDTANQCIEHINKLYQKYSHFNAYEKKNTADLVDEFKKRVNR